MSAGGYWETLKSMQVPGAAITAAAETSLLTAQAKATLLPGFFRNLGQELRIEAAGKISSVITTPGTARFKVKFGSTIVFDGLAVLLDTVAAHTDVFWKLLIELTLQVGPSGAAQLMGHGTFTTEDLLGVPASAPKGVLTAALPWNTVPVLGTAFDSEASQIVDLTYTQTVATGSITCQRYNLISPN